MSLIDEDEIQREISIPIVFNVGVSFFIPTISFCHGIVMCDNKLPLHI
jgi:hypothetical protein